MEYTHRVAVIAYLIFEEKFLFLKRNNPPKIWAPPGGRLHRNEAPEDGLHREIYEECGISIKETQLVHSWFGPWEGGHLLSLDYLAIADTANVKLSSEHSDFTWVSLADLKNGTPIKLDEPVGFKMRDFEQAFAVYRNLKTPGI